MSSDIPGNLEPVCELRDEGQHLVDNLSSDKLRVDFIARLPPELAIKIVTYLKPWDLFLFRSVSNRWNQFLSSPEVCSSSFRSYFRDEALDTADPDWPRLFLKCAKRLLAGTTGRPYSKGFIKEPDNSGIVRYYDGKIVIPQPDGAIKLLWLADGRTASFHTESPGFVHYAAISQTAVAAITETGHCYVWNYKSGDKGITRLPNADYSSDLILVEDTIALCVGSKSTTLITWNPRSKHPTEIQLPCRPVHILANPEKKTLVVMHVVDEVGIPILPEGYFSGIVGTEYFIHDILAPHNKATYFMPPLDRPNSYLCWNLSTQGMCILQLQPEVEAEEDESEEYVSYVLFVSHHQDGSARLYREVISEISNKKFDSDCWETCSLSQDVILYSFDDFVVVDYEDAVSNTAEISEIERAMGGVFAPPELSELLSLQSLTRFIAGDGVDKSIGFGDGTFFGLATSDGIYFWCFDEDIALADEIPEYRKIRSDRALARSLERKKLWADKQAVREGKMEEDSNQGAD
ncbi:hypothetical protein FQN53_005125 [Emmonsiellopsis sp. PD_33]|nr:hypothetical protein FQN53_005125 [Emmonsiellopsis sp. PD_33]